MSGKRGDLQGLRGVAILAVVAFHFFPSHFPNGFVGVDQFFVLSGFLMCMLLDKEADQPPANLVLHFYSRRLKRILPVYLLVVFVVLVALFAAFPTTAVETNMESAQRALVFASNQPKSQQTSYFELLHVAMDTFAHTWSLSVEIQFYALVPFLFLLSRVLPRTFQSKYYLFLGLLSFAFHAFSSTNTAFYSMFARIWQFLIGFQIPLSSSRTDLIAIFGMVAYMEDGRTANKKLWIPVNTVVPTAAEAQPLTMQIDEDEDVKFDIDDQEKELDSVVQVVSDEQNHELVQLIALVLMLFGAFAPMHLDLLYVRLNTTVLSGLLLSSSSAHPFLSSRVLSYLGDISYSLYMVHWPIYALCVLNFENDNRVLLIGLACAFLLAALVTHTFERWQMRSAPGLVLATILVLYALNVSVLVLQRQIEGHKLDKNLEDSEMRRENFDADPANMTKDEVMATNNMYNTNDYFNLMISHCKYNPIGPLGLCRFQGLKRSSKYKLLLVGNSWTANHGKIIYQECKDKTYNMTQLSAYGCEPLWPYDNNCKNNLKEVEALFRDLKPDYAFIIFRVIQMGDNFTSTNLLDDEKYKFAKERLLFYREHVKIKLFVLDSIPWNSNYIATIIQTGLLTNKTINDTLIVDEPSLAIHERAKQRMAQLFTDCGPKCERIDYEPSFFNTTANVFRYYDEYGLEYFTSPKHLSPHGLEVVRPLYRRICRSL